MSPPSRPLLRPMAGARLVELERHRDDRGSLVAFAEAAPIPFAVRRAFFIVDCPVDAVRAEHAVSGTTALVALSAGVTVDLDNGTEQRSLRLEGPAHALVVDPGVWMRLREFEPHTALAVLSSQAHAETTYYDSPAYRSLSGVAS